MTEKERRILGFGLIALGYLALASHAEAAPIQGQTPRTKFFLGTALRSFVKVSHAANGNAERHVVQIPTILNYNLATDAVVTLVVPYVIKEFRLRDKTHQDVRGVGDIRIIGKYRFYRDDFPRGSKQMAFSAGLELPTGSTTKKKDGVKLPRPRQLGSGGVDPLFGFAGGWISAYHAVEGGVQFKYNSRHDGFRFGPVLNYDLAYAYSIYPKWPIENAQLNLLLEFNGEHRERNKSGSSKVRASGGDTIFLSPGIQFILFDNALVETSFQFPVLDQVNGKQLYQDYRVLFGFRILF
ncbi:MAG: transporter [Deltaproteobacteria bacterium]|nr:transporter [Deltaproteobacteria bacterium]